MAPRWIGGGAAALVVVACASERADPAPERVRQSILGGERDTEHGAVVALRQYLEGAEDSCSGTLVSIVEGGPDAEPIAAILTAAHCTHRLPSEILIGDDFFDLSAKRYAPIDVSRHPDYRTGDPESPFDLAIVRVTGDLRGLQSMSVAGELEPALAPGQELIAVGFGLTAIDGGGGYGARHRAALRVYELTEQDVRVAQGDGVGICFGDSGGPLIAVDASGNERVVAVHTRVESLDPAQPVCLGTSISSRVQNARDFLASSIQASPPNRCTLCRARARSEGGECLAEQRACEAEPLCRIALQCTRACATDVCRQKCLRGADPERIATLESITTCACRRCMEPCETPRCDTSPLPPAPLDASVPDASADASEADILLPDGGGCSCVTQRGASPWNTGELPWWLVWCWRRWRSGAAPAARRGRAGGRSR